MERKLEELNIDELYTEMLGAYQLDDSDYAYLCAELMVRHTSCGEYPRCASRDEVDQMLAEVISECTPVSPTEMFHQLELAIQAEAAGIARIYAQVLAGLLELGIRPEIKPSHRFEDTLRNVLGDSFDQDSYPS